MAARYPAENGEDGQCGMCLEDLTNLEDVRQLTCQHVFCLGCLTENQQISNQTICPICRFNHGVIADMNALSIVHQKKVEEKVSYACGVKECTAACIQYCKQCDKLFCGEHVKAHDILLAVHQKLIVSEYAKWLEEDELRYCDHHKNQVLTVACRRCFVLKCDDCDQQLVEECDDAQVAHTLGSIDNVAKSVKGKLRNLVNEMTKMEDDLMNRMKAELKRNPTAEQVLNGKFATISIKITDLTKTAGKFMRGTNATFLRDHGQLCENIEILLREDSPLYEKPRSIHSHEGSSGSQQKILEIQHNEGVSTAKGRKAFTICHLSSGELVIGGERSLVKMYGCELPRTRKLRGEDHSVCSVIEFSQNLYVLSTANHYKKDLHVFSGVRNWRREFVIQYNCTGVTHLTVNESFIIMVDCSAQNLRVYATDDHQYLFSMKNFSGGKGHLWGIATLPDDTVVVSDHKKGRLLNLTVEEYPKIIWCCGGLQKPTGIAFDPISATIVVAAFNSTCYLVSQKGILQQEITLAACQGNDIYDVSVHGDFLVTADGSDVVDRFAIIRDSASQRF